VPGVGAEHRRAAAGPRDRWSLRRMRIVDLNRRAVDADLATEQQSTCVNPIEPLLR